jgi:Tol biopolymer transport system component
MFLEDPVWSVDGKYLYASYRSPVRDKSGAVVGQKVGIQRLEVTTGKRELLLEDGREPAPSADGKSLVFIGVAASTMTFDYSFKIMDLQTRQIRELTNPSQNFIAFYFPRLSPDGKWIVFSAIGGPDSITSQPNPLPSGTTGAGGGVRAALLHGLPYDLWLIRPDGSGLRRLTVLFEDQPMPVWSKDSQRVIFLAGQGFYSVEITTGSLLKISDEGSHGGFDYRE